MSHTLTMRAGQTGRLRFDIRPVGDYVLAGAVRSGGGAAVAMEQRGGELFIPAGLAPGLHLLEVRASGRTVLYGGLEILPSPLAGQEGETAWNVEADLSEEVAQITLTLSEGPSGPAGERGPAGPQGEPGTPGEPGVPGKSAYELWLSAGNSGSLEDYLASLHPTPQDVREAIDSDLFLPEVEVLRTPEGSGNGYMNDLELDACHVPVGLLCRVDVRARSSGANPSTCSYLGLWEQSEDGVSWVFAGVSTNAPGQYGGQDAVWLFDDVALHGRPLRLLVMDSREAVWRVGNKLGICTTMAPDGDGSHIHYGGGTYRFLPQMTLHFRRPRGLYAPVEHVDDATVHVSAQEHDWLAKQCAGGGMAAFRDFVTLGYLDRQSQVSPGGLADACDLCLEAGFASALGWGYVFVWFGVGPSELFLQRLWHDYADVVDAFHCVTLPVSAWRHGAGYGEWPPYVFPGGTREFADGSAVYPGGTREDAGGERVYPDGTREDAGGYRFYPGGTVEEPGGGVVCPGGTRGGASGTFLYPGGSREFPSGTSVFPDGTREFPGGTRYRPQGGGVELPGGSVELPGGSVELPGGTVELPGGSVEWPGGTVEWPGGSVELPGGTVEWPLGTVVRPDGGEVSYPGGTTVLPDGTLGFPGGTVVLPGGSVVLP